MTEMLFILVFNSFTGAMQQYENELFDVFQVIEPPKSPLLQLLFSFCDKIEF